jgi:hypothetical protein
MSDWNDEEEASHFQYQDGTCFAQITSSTNRKFEPRIAQLFKKKINGSKLKLNLQQIIIMDSGSTLDLFCNQSLVEHIEASPLTLRLKSNGGTMKVTCHARLPGYKMPVWFSLKAITNIIALRNIIRQFCVTYDSNQLMFVVHRPNLPNMEFRMHESGLHFYDPRTNNQFAFVSTVSQNMENFTKRQIKEARVARTLYGTLCYPSKSDFKWIIRSHQIKDCPVTVENVEVASQIWGDDIAALKGKTTRSKPIPVARDFI